MKYKIGDKVRVKSVEWYNANKDEYGDVKCYDCQETDIKCQDTIYFITLMSEYCGEIVTIDKIWEDYSYSIIEDNHKFDWTDDMFEGLAEEGIYDEEFKNAINDAYNAYLDDKDDIDPLHELCEKLCNNKLSTLMIDSEVCDDEVELILNDYEIEVRGDKTYAVKKKPKYPMTYEECCQHLGCDDKLSAGKLLSFQQLINARNAYWKIAGEEMGLDEPWEPTMETVYCISRIDNVIKCSYRGGKSNILEFPTAEMRDAFYENFKDLIEKCKELL